MLIYNSRKGYVQSEGHRQEWGFEGLFETLLWSDGELLDLKMHQYRISESYSKLYGSELRQIEIEDIVNNLVLENKLQDLVRVRYVVDLRNEHSIQSVAVEAYQRSLKPVKLRTSHFHPELGTKILGHKSCFYRNYAIALQDVKAQKCDEALLYNSEKTLCEGATSNIFFVKNNIVYTPGLATGCLPGIVRDLTIRKLTRSKIVVKEGSYLADDITQADCLFITNSLRRVQFVDSLDGQKFNQAGKELRNLLRNI